MSEIMMFVDWIPLFIIANEIFEIVGKEVRVVVDFAEPFGLMGVMVGDVDPGSPHFLPDVTAYLDLFLFIIFTFTIIIVICCIGGSAIIPRSRHVHKDNILRKRPQWKLGVMFVIPLIVDISQYGIPLDSFADYWIGEEINDVASFAPRVHDGVVELFVPDEGYHAVDSIVGVFIIISFVGIIVAIYNIISSGVGSSSICCCIGRRSGILLQ